MDATALRAMQAPLKDRYKSDPKAAYITLRAKGTLDDTNIACKVETGRALAVAGLHPATGGSGLELCSGDMLLEALVACAGVTLKAVSTALEIPLKSGHVSAEGDLPVIAGDGTSKSAASRRFVALSAERLAAWMASDLSKLDLLVIQIDGLHIGNDLVLVAALGIDGEGHKHPLALLEGATENAAIVQALIDNLIERGLDPKVCRLFIIDGAKALSKVIRRTFGVHTPIQRCQIHKARNVIERLAKPLHAPVRRALRQAWELDDADNAERLLRNLARRLDHEAPGVAASILEGLDEMLTVNRLGLPVKLRRSLACTNSIENMMGTVRRVCRNVKRWRNAAMALRWTAAGMMEAARGFRRLKAYKHLPVLKAALAAHQSKYVTQRVEQNANAA